MQLVLLVYKVQQALPVQPVHKVLLDLQAILDRKVQQGLREPTLQLRVLPAQLVQLAQQGQPATREHKVQQEAQELRVRLAIQVLQEVQDLPDQLAVQAQQDRLVLLAHKVLLEQPELLALQVPQALQG